MRSQSLRGLFFSLVKIQLNNIFLQLTGKFLSRVDKSHLLSGLFGLERYYSTDQALYTFPTHQESCTDSVKMFFPLIVPDSNRVTNAQLTVSDEFSSDLFLPK